MKTGFIKGAHNGKYKVFGAFFQSKPRKSGQIWQIEMKMPKMESSRPVDSLKKNLVEKFSISMEKFEKQKTLFH